MTVLRALDWAERYYWLLDRLGPMNIGAVAELDRRLDAREIAGALEQAQRRHPLLRARVDVVDGELSFVEAEGPIPLEVEEPGPTEWAAVLAAHLDRRFAAPEPFARCVYLPISEQERSVLVLLVHHSVGDARAAVSVLQQVLRHVARRNADEPPQSDVPPPLHDLFPAELRAPRAALDVLATVRAERSDQGPVAAYAAHDRGDHSQSSRLDRLMLEPDPADAFRVAARQDGATVTGRVAAAVLESSAELFDGPAQRLLALATPTDLRRHVDPAVPDDTVMLAIGLLCTPYAVSPAGNPELASSISAQTRRELDRGESHLFYRFARAGSFESTDDGVRAFADSMAAAPHNVGISNLGVIDDTGDPDWVRSISFALSASSNQLAFVAVTTYRGRLVMNVATDRARLAAEVADRLVAGIRDRTGAVTSV